MQPDITKYTKNSLAFYPFGSRVYGTTRPDSDWDYVAVKGKIRLGEMNLGSINIRYYTPEQFQALLEGHHIMALECYFLKPEQAIVVPDQPWNFTLNRAKLRHSLSEKSSHSWVKAQKKFLSPYDRDAELNRGKKSLWHSMRIISFGIQIARFKTIIGYNEVNHIYNEIMEDQSMEWNHYKEKWKPVYNKMLTSFRESAPK